MANVFKNILDSLKLTDEDDFDDYEEYEEAENKERERKRKEREEAAALRYETKEKKTASGSFSRQTENRRQMAADDTEEAESSFADLRKERAQRAERLSSNRVVPLRSASASRSLEVCIMKPTTFEDSQDICDMLMQGRATVVNLEGLDLDLAQHIMYFISGSVYALNGKLHQISGYIFIISPDSVDISGDYLNFIEQTKFEVPNLK